jgi:vacuolar protein sorting-associated protein 16
LLRHCPHQKQQEKKSPIGYEPFVDLCIEANANPEAAKYVPKIVVPATRAEYFLKLGMWREAAEVALKEKDPELLTKLRNGCTTKESVMYFDNLLSQFQSKK